VNEEWISDKTRYAWEGLGRQRLDKAYVRENGKLRPTDWPEALTIAAEKLGGDASKIGMIAGDLCSAEEMKAAKDLADALGVVSTDCRQDGAKVGSGAREDYLFNATIAGIEEADAILIIGSNPRTEAAILNARIRKTWLHNDTKVGLIGEAVDLTYPYEHVGTSADILAGLKKKRSGFIKTLKDAKRPLILVGSGALTRADGAQVLRAAGELADAVGAVSAEWNGLSILHTAASRVAGLDLGFVPGEGGHDVAGMQSTALDTVVLMGADELDMSQFGDAFVIYVGSHGDAGAHRADLILPSAAWTEQDGLFANTEGRVQLAYRATFPKGDAKEGWAIFRALSERLGKTLPYNNLTELRHKLFDDVPVLAGIDHAPGARDGYDAKAAGAAGDVEATDFVPAVRNFYFTNPIARASKTLAECSALASGPAQMAAE
jgi:NADH-quinone oxidoreductase subunit G